jgi:hypothetical protein
VVDNGKVEKSAGNIGNTGSNSCAVLVLLRFKHFEPPSKTKLAARKI